VHQLSEWNIIYKYLAPAANKKDKRFYQDTFKTIQQLKVYFERIPGSGPLVGYGRKQPYHNWAFSAALQFEWTDEEGNHLVEFENVHKFVQFLIAYPEIASCVQFESKNKR
jgi:hypothetical protein